ncbi:MAG: helix-turn-helix domain-containing protein [Propionibacterium sp.]|nr:helix-turn-helix domain-containing protein [Propionibacterium sp.]
MSTLSPSNISSSPDERGVRDEIVIDGKSFGLDEHAAAVIRNALEALQRGSKVEISEAAEFISTQAAADMLGISRPSLVKLLDAGVIPSQRPGSHRRVRRAEVDAFIASRPTRRTKAMEALHESRTPQDDSLDGFVPTR